MARKLYPLGIHTFERIRKEDKLYIDKTEYVYHMTHTGGTCFLLGMFSPFRKNLCSSLPSKATSRIKRLVQGTCHLKIWGENGRSIWYCISTRVVESTWGKKNWKDTTAESPDFFNPYSLLNCFNENKFGSYCFSSGTPTHLK